MIQILGIHEHPQLLEHAADYFSSKWGVSRKLYHESMTDSITTKLPFPRWYLMQRDDKTIGGFGLIENDFMVRTDLFPWLCALYVEESERGNELGAKLLAHARSEAAKMNLSKLYLNTDHIGYYEKYGWHYIGDHDHKSGDKARVYETDVISPPVEMTSFFNVRAETYDNHMLVDLKLDVFYEAIASLFEGTACKNILDLGCGTGLELERLFKLFPGLQVTGIDLSTGMLEQLKTKYPGNDIRLICGSYFDTDFGNEYDHVLSTYSLHHFNEDQKTALYKKIHTALSRGGRFIFGDYTVKTPERQQELLAESESLRRKNGITVDEIIHFDTPFTAEAEIKLMKTAGFASANVVQQWEKTSIIVASK